MTDSEYRKLQVTGGSTMIVSLPREWVKANQMKKGDVVFIEEMSSGGLHISAMQSESSKSTVTIDCCKLSDGLVDLLIGAYLSGADIIKVVCSSNIPRKVRKDIRNFLRDTRGMEIGLDEDKEIRILSILDPSELSFQVSINRMYILISSLVNMPTMFSWERILNCFQTLKTGSVKSMQDDCWLNDKLQLPSRSQLLSATLEPIDSLLLSTQTSLEFLNEWVITLLGWLSWSETTPRPSRARRRKCHCEQFPNGLNN